MKVIDIRERLNNKKGEYIASVDINLPYRAKGYPSMSIITTREFDADFKRLLADQMVLLAKLLYDEASDDDGEVLAMFRVYESSRCVGRLTERVDTEAGRAWLKETIRDFDTIIDATEATE